MRPTRPAALVAVALVEPGAGPSRTAEAGGPPEGVAPDPPLIAVGAPGDLPHQYTVPVQSGSCPGEAAFGSSSADWENWPEGSPQLRLEAPAGEPQWSLTITASCIAREDQERAWAELPDPPQWGIDSLIASTDDQCGVLDMIALPGFDHAFSCFDARGRFTEEDSFYDLVAAIDDEHAVHVTVVVSPNLTGADGTIPGDLDQARPMLELAEEALLHLEVRLGDG